MWAKMDSSTEAYIPGYISYTYVLITIFKIIALVEVNFPVIFILKERFWQQFTSEARNTADPEHNYMLGSLLCLGAPSVEISEGFL